MNIEIKVKADQPLMTLLERVADALERLSATPDRMVTLSKPSAVEATKPEQEVEPQTAEPVPAEPVADQPEEVKPTVTLDEIRKKVVTLSALGAETKEVVRGIITEYCRKVSDLAPEKYTEVMDRLNALQEG